MSNVTITTAIKLSADQLKTLTTAVMKSAGKTAEVTAVVDPSILGGVVVTIGSRQIDNSYRTKISTVKQQIITAITE